MKRIHLICRNRDGISPISFPTFESRAWDIPEQDAVDLIGGMIHFHETKSEPSYFGGLVRSFRIEQIDAAHSKRVVFVLESVAEARKVKWSGRSDVNAHYSGLVEN